MIEVEVNNFQSITHVCLVVQGFVSIVGRSNTGKSAIARALRYALTGAVGTSFVRHGLTCERRLRGAKKCHCFASVRVKTSQIEVVWAKGDTENRYTVTRNGRTDVYEGLERGTPDFLLPDFRTVRIGTGKELIQIAKQFEPVFLLDQSGPVVADVLSDVARLDGINSASSLVSKDRKSAVSERRVRCEDLADYNGRLTRYVGLDQVPVEAVREQQQAANTARERVRVVVSFLDRALILKRWYEAITKALRPKVPEYSQVRDLDQAVRQVHDYLISSERLVSFVGNVERALSPRIEAPDAIREASRCLRLVVGFEAFHTTLTSTVAAAEGPATCDLPVYDGIQQQARELTQVGRFSETLSLRAQTYRRLLSTSNLTIPPEPSALVTEARQLQDLGRILIKFSEFTETIHKLSQELSNLESEFRRLDQETKELGVCPTCGQIITVVHVHSEVA